VQLLLWLTVVALAVLAVSAWALAYWSTHPIRIPVPNRPPLRFGSPADIAFRSDDGVPLSGWYFAHERPRAVLVLCHGHQFNRLQVLDVMEGLRDGPFAFVLFDFRCAGRSGGALSTIGAEEVRDLRAALGWIETRQELRALPVGVFGYSMGGAVAIMAASDDLRIGAVATQGAYASLDRAIEDRGRFFIGALGPALARPAMAIGRHWLGRDPAEVSPLRAIARISPRPVMVCHGEWDPFISAADARMLFDAAGDPKVLRILPRSWHIGVAADQRAAYYRALRAFFETALTAP
jgi:fermentation-respiration switch protein FrsA (DUF1100 family)